MSNFLPEPMDIDTPPVSATSMLRFPGEQDHGSRNGTQPVTDPLYFQVGLENPTQDANQCVVCLAQFSTDEKLREHVWSYQVRRRRYPIEVV